MSTTKTNFFFTTYFFLTTFVKNICQQLLLIRGRSYIMSYRLGVGGGKRKYDTLWQGGGWGYEQLWCMTMTGGGLKVMNIMAKSKQKTLKKGVVFAWKYNNYTITMWIRLNSNWFHHSKLIKSSPTPLKWCLKIIRLMK